MEKTFQQRNAENMRQLFDLLLKPQPREAYTTRKCPQCGLEGTDMTHKMVCTEREPEDIYAEGYLAGFVDAVVEHVCKEEGKQWQQ